MNRIIPLFLCVALLCPLQTFSQHCGFDKQIEEAIESDPHFLSELQVRETKINSIKFKSKRSAKPDMVIVPVVVHVLHTGEAIGVGSNISDQQIHSAIAQLNKAFNGEDHYVTPSTGIRFELAKRTPDCTPSNGIIRKNARAICVKEECYINSGITKSNEVALKALSIWPARDYLNIWVVAEIDNNDGLSGIQAYAQFPGGDPSQDGIVILANAFGFQQALKGPYNLKNNTRLGAVLIHEVGHTLGLYHSFEGDDYNRDGVGDRCPSFTGCGPYNGDCIDDTPPHRRSLGTCNTDEINVCDGGFPGDLFVHNFMDYSSEECQNEFTQGQVNRMVATLQSLRPGWINSIGALPVLGTSPEPQVCQPQTRYLPNNYGLGIQEFKVGAYQHLSGSATDDGGYLDNWCSVLEVRSGQSYPIQLNTGTQNIQNVKVYVDYNNDGDFVDNGEEVFKSSKKKIHAGNFTIPTYAVKGTPLRVRCIASYAGFSISDPCFKPYFGQVEDYSMIIDAPSADAQGDLSGLANNTASTAFELEDNEADYLIFPNPSTNDRIFLRTNATAVQRIELLDAGGSLVGFISTSLDKRDIAVNMQNTVPGIYYLRITDADNVTIRKINRF